MKFDKMIADLWYLDTCVLYLSKVADVPAYTFRTLILLSSLMRYHYWFAFEVSANKIAHLH